MKRNRIIIPVYMIGILLCAIMGYGIFSARLPAEAPLARMYRTEADLAALVKAVEVYHDDLGAYPPGGMVGLQLAVRHLSQEMDYMPDGPPPDAWGQSFHYVPYYEYEIRTEEALRCDAGFCAPDTFQLYSSGADGLIGIANVSSQEDNIISWMSNKPWRRGYHEMNQRYMDERTQ